MANYHLVQQRGAVCNFTTQSDFYREEFTVFGKWRPRTTLNGDKSGAKTTLCRHGDLGMQIVTSIYAVSSRFGLGGD